MYNPYNWVITPVKKNAKEESLNNLEYIVMKRSKILKDISAAKEDIKELEENISERKEYLERKKNHLRVYEKEVFKIIGSLRDE